MKEKKGFVLNVRENQGSNTKKKTKRIENKSSLLCPNNALTYSVLSSIVLVLCTADNALTFARYRRYTYLLARS